MVKHTSGPWFCDTYEGVVGDVSDANGNSVAQAQARQPLAAGKPDEERLANARLIAAAPDLLEALEQVVAWKEAAHMIAPELGGLLKSFYVAEHAISKAKGEANAP